VRTLSLAGETAFANGVIKCTSILANLSHSFSSLPNHEGNISGDELALSTGTPRTSPNDNTPTIVCLLLSGSWFPWKGC